MNLTQEMKDFILARKSRASYCDDVLDDFFEKFPPDDEVAAEKAFHIFWNSAANPVPVTRTAGPAQIQGGQTSELAQASPDANLLTAPFRFVPLNDRIAFPEQTVRKAWAQGTLHDHPMPDGYCGRLRLRIRFDGPMLVGQPSRQSGQVVDGPVKVGNHPVIPGATLRGLTRATLEAAAFSRLSQTNLHRRFGIRDFEHELFSDEERKRVHAGWLRPVQPEDGCNTDYVIEQCRWFRIRIRDLKGEGSDSAEWQHDWLSKSMAAHYDAFAMTTGGRIDFDAKRTFELPDGDEDGALVSPATVGKPGVLVFSGRVASFSNNGLTAVEIDTIRKKGSISETRAEKEARESEKRKLQIKALNFQDTNREKGNTKRTEVVFAADGDTLKPVPRVVWDTFLDSNTRPSRHQRKPVGNWQTLSPTLDAGHRIPVFWVADGAGQVADFGLVRVFKRAHAARVVDILYNTGRGVHRADPDDPDFCPDFVEALFGYVHEPEDANLSNAAQHGARHLKSRVSFGFARLAEGCNAQEAPPVTTVQAAPKPSFAAFYLASDGRKDWSAPGVELAGRKVYPPRNADSLQLHTTLSQLAAQAGNQDNDTKSHLVFLNPAVGEFKLVFEADIHVHNVTAAELGGLIWALTLGGDADLRHMIGRAKTAGAGQARIEVTSCDVTDLHDRPITVEAARAAFETLMGAQVTGWANSEPLCALLAAANPTRWTDAKLGYLALSEHKKLRDFAYKDVRQTKRFLGVPI